MSKNAIAEMFATQQIDPERQAKVDALPDPELRYVIAITPRSGSSLLCDVMTSTKRLGRPGEKLEAKSIRGNLRAAPSRTPDEYLRNVLRINATRNGVSGLKASWFQFNNFSRLMVDRQSLKSLKYIYLTRRDLYAQSVSLYKATESRVFHTNIEHTQEALQKLKALEYDYARLAHWHQHLVAQEAGWQRFFDQQGIHPLAITYEDIENDVHTVVRRVAAYLGLPTGNLGLGASESIFKKLGDRSSVVWAARFMLERAAEQRHAATAEAATA